MQPEDIDQLFRAKLEQHATPPPPSLWYDLQEQLEPEEKKRRGGFWLYALAAAVTLLLVAGGGWLMWQTQRPSAGTLASTAPNVQRGTDKAADATAAHSPAADFNPAAPLAPGTVADAGRVAAQSATSPDAEKTLKNSGSPQATAAARPASTQQQPPLLARTEDAAAPRTPVRPEAPVFRAPEPPVAERHALAVQPVPAAANALQPAAEATSAAAPALAAGAIEVEVRQHPETALALAAAETAETPGRTRPSVRGVLRQVRRLAQGEKPDLTEVGLPANPALTVQARVAGHTLTKTIAL